MITHKKRKIQNCYVPQNNQTWLKFATNKVFSQFVCFLGFFMAWVCVFYQGPTTNPFNMRGHCSILLDCTQEIINSTNKNSDSKKAL